MDGRHITSPQWSPELGLQLVPWPLVTCEQWGRCSGEQAVTGSDGGVRGGAAVQLSSGLRIWSLHWSLITTTHAASVSCVTAIGRYYTRYLLFDNFDNFEYIYLDTPICKRITI